MDYKITYYTEGKLNVTKTAKSHAQWYAKHYLNLAKSRIMELCA